MADPASKKDFQEVISNLKTFQDVASEKRRKQDQIKYNEDQKRLMEIGKELKEANATDTLKLEAEKDKIKQERSIEKLKQESGKRAVEIQKSGIELQKKAIEATGGVASDNKEYREEEKRIKLAELAERKRTATSPAAKKEIAKEERELLGNYFERFLGKDSRLASGLTSIGEGLKAKVKGGLEGIFAAIKAGAFIAFLGAVSAFLKSDLFKDMKDKYLPVIADGVKSLFDTLKGIVDGFFDEDGNFSAAAGFKNIFDELSTAFTNFGTNLKESFLDENGDLTLKSAIAGIPDAFGVLLGAFINPVTGLLAILAPRKFFGAAVWVGKKLFGNALRRARGGFGKLFTSIGLFSDELGTTASNMDGQVSKSKKTGVFRRGLQGVTGIFKGLFTRVGRFGGLLLGIRQTMNTDLDKFSKTGKDVSNRFTGFDKPIRGVETQLGNTQRTMQADLDKSKKTGVFRKGLQGTGGKFGRLFRVLGKFGGLLGGVGLTMLSFLDPSSLGKVFTTVGDSFKSLFGAVKDFGSKVTNSAFKMGQNVIDASKTGVFSIANGIGTGFTKLFTKVGDFGTKIGTAVSGMGKAITDSTAFSTVSAKFSGFFGKVTSFGSSVSDTVSGMGEAIKNSTAFSTVSEKFSGFFGKVGDFGTKVADRAKILGESVTNSSVFKALSTTFDSLFGVITNFGKEIGKVASAAAGATADAVKSALKSVASIGAKPDKIKIKIPTEVDPSLKRAQANITKTSIGTPKVDNTPKPFVDDAPLGDGNKADKIITAKQKPTVTTDLGDGAKLDGSGTDGTSPKYSSSSDNVTKAGTTSGLANVDTTLSKGVVIDTKSSKIIQPKIKLTTESMTKSFLKRGGLGALKMIPIAGAIVGLGASAWRALTGDLVGGAAELAGVFAPSVAGLPIDAGLMARDMYKDQFGVFPEQEKDKALAAERMKTIAKFVKDKISKRSTPKSSKAQIKPSETSSDTIDFSKIRNFKDYQKVQGQLRINPNYDADGSGIYNKKEFRAAQGGAKLEGSGSKYAQGPMFLQPTRIVTNNQQSVVISRPITDTSFGGIMSSR